MLYLIWIFLVGSIVVMIADMMLEEWAGMDVLEGGTKAAQWIRQRLSGSSPKKTSVPAFKASKSKPAKVQSKSKKKR